MPIWHISCAEQLERSKPNPLRNLGVLGFNEDRSEFAIHRFERYSLSTTLMGHNGYRAASPGPVTQNVDRPGVVAIA